MTCIWHASCIACVAYIFRDMSKTKRTRVEYTERKAMTLSECLFSTNSMLCWRVSTSFTEFCREFLLTQRRADPSLWPRPVLDVPQVLAGDLRMKTRACFGEDDNKHAKNEKNKAHNTKIRIWIGKKRIRTKTALQRWNFGRTQKFRLWLTEPLPYVSHRFTSFHEMLKKLF